MVSLAEPNSASAARQGASSTRAHVSPYVALLIEVGLPIALVVLSGFAGSRFSEISSTVNNPPTNLEAYVMPVENDAANTIPIDVLPVENNAVSKIPIDVRPGENEAWVAAVGNSTLRVRLGDTVYDGRVLTGPRSRSYVHLFKCAIADQRVDFKASAPRGSPAVSQKRSDARPKKSSSTLAFLATDPTGLRLVGYVEPTSEVQQMKPPTQTAMALQSKMPAPPPAKRLQPSPPANAAPQIAQPAVVTTSTTPEIITAATMTALLQADARGITSIRIGESGAGDTGLSNDDYSKAVLSGVTRLFDRLGSVTQIFIHEYSANSPRDTWRKILLPRSAWLWRLYATPLPVPGDTSLIEPPQLHWDSPRYPRSHIRRSTLQH